MKTICIKLSSGEEIIARQPTEQLFEGKSISEVDVIVKDAHIIQLTQVREGMAISFIPWAMGATSSTITINGNHVTSKYEPDTEMERGFLSQISKIDLPAAPASKIIV